MRKAPETSRFRTHRQMAEVYRTLEGKGQAEVPYVLEYRNLGQTLIFIGSIHTANPTHPQVRLIDKKWNEFIDHSNKQKHVFSEGNLRPVNGRTKDQAIASDAESGQICWLANDAKIPNTSPEPDRAKEIDYLHKRGHSYEKIFTYYFARQMLQWVNYDHKTQPDWKAYADRLSLYKSVHDFGGLELNLDSMLGMYRQVSGKDFSIEDKQTLYDLSDPGQNAISSASGLYRDYELFSAIKTRWNDGCDVFIVYGSGHAIVLEPALEKLTGTSSQHD